jgi:hypothetical protein
METTLNIIVDELGKVNEAIAELEATASKLKAELKARGVGTYEGAVYSAEVQEYDRENISAPLVRKIADQWFLQQVTVTQHVKAVVVARLEA